MIHIKTDAGVQWFRAPKIRGVEYGDGVYNLTLETKRGRNAPNFDLKLINEKIYSFIFEIENTQALEPMEANYTLTKDGKVISTGLAVVGEFQSETGSENKNTNIIQYGSK